MAVSGEKLRIGHSHAVNDVLDKLLQQADLADARMALEGALSGLTKATAGRLPLLMSSNRLSVTSFRCAVLALASAITDFEYWNGLVWPE